MNKFPNIGDLVASKTEMESNYHYVNFFIYLGKKELTFDTVYRLWCIAQGCEVYEYKKSNRFFQANNSAYIIVAE